MAASSDKTVRAALAQTERILSSPHFARSQALSRLLRFIVEQTLKGEADELKEYRLGVEVLGRGEDFDPRIDPIVRLQAAKLRSRLAEYYDNEGRSERLVISIPKGGYSATFEHLEDQEPARTTSAKEFRSIAVLPFVNMSADPENEYFSDGLTEELINLLTTVDGLRVVARTSVFCFKNAARDVREIGSKLNVQTVLEGSVRKAGNQLRVTAQLIDVSSGYHLMSRTYPREMTDVFAVQEELATAVVTEIMPQVRGERPDLALRVQTTDLTAYNLYLKGMFTMSKAFHGPREAIDIFEQVLRRDPNYAPASAGIAFAFFALSWFGTIAPREGLSRARAAAQNAVRLDKNLGLAHAILGAVHAVLDWNWTEAENSFQYAIETQPGLALPYHLHANICLLREGRITEAVTEIQHAVSLNPFDPILRAAAVHAYNLAGNYVSAQENYDFGVEINPRTFLLHLAIGLAHQVRGQFDKAIAVFQTGCEVSGRAPLVVAALGHALAQSGQRKRAEALLPEVLSSAHPLATAILYLGLGRNDECLDWLDRAAEARIPYVLMVPVDPRFAHLRAVKRFGRFLEQLRPTGKAVSNAQTMVSSS